MSNANFDKQRWYIIVFAICQQQICYKSPMRSLFCTCIVVVVEI